jgi:hypothetical protein
VLTLRITLNLKLILSNIFQARKNSNKECKNNNQNASEEQNYQVTPENNKKEKRRRQLVYNNFETSLNKQYWQ